MTLPREEKTSIAIAEQLLMDLLRLPRIPQDVRDDAYRALRHFPASAEADKLGITSLMERRKQDAQ